MIYSKEETITKEDLWQQQIEKLQSTLYRVYRNVAFYKENFDKNKINIENIRSLNDLEKLPFTTKEDLRQSYPYGMFAVPLRDIVRIHSTSGTTGKPIAVGYTQNDLNHWSTLVARILKAAGLSENDFIQIAFNYGLQTGGFGFHYGAEKIGASVIPSSSENIENQINIMKDYKTTALISTPGYALHISNVLKEMNLHPEKLSLKIGLFGSESWSEKLRTQIENSLHIKVFDNYGLSEIIGPGVAFECEKRNGLHVNEDHFILEVIDPKTLKRVKDGEEGELVFTTITKEGFPLIRYRTGDISAIIPDDCTCGRSFRRIKRISGRTDNMIICEGINIFPSQIEQELLAVEGVEPHYQIILFREKGIEKIEIQVEVSPDIPFFDELKKLSDLKSEIENHLNTKFGIKTKVTLVEPKSLRRSSGKKIKRVIDKRDI